MKTTLHAHLIAVLLLFMVPAAHAIQTTWEITGHVTESLGSFATNFPANTPFRVLVSFDTAAAPLVTSAGATGNRFFYPGESLQYVIFMGAACNPCRPEVDSGQSGILLRDNYSTTSAPTAVDGITFNLVTPDQTTINFLMRGPVLDIFNGPGLPEVPDPRLAGLALAALDVCDNPGNDCANGEVHGQIDAISIPTYGTGYLFTARDCRVQQFNTADATPFDCVNRPGSPAQLWSSPPQGVIGGGVGTGGFVQTHAPMSDDIDTTWGTTNHAAMGLPNVSLGNLSGAISFGGPVALPVVKGTSLPSDWSRTNTNLFAYQKYDYTGAVTLLPLVLDLTFTIGDFNVNDPEVSNEVGLRPGGAEIAAVLTVIDGNVSMNMVRDAGNAGFNNLTCGAEADLGWPAGSILGVAAYNSASHLVGAQAVLRNVDSCAQPGQAVQLAAGQSFIVATSMQLPARGKAPQPPSTAGAGANGFVDAANTLRVTFDPAAPPALVQQLAQDIAPACTGCRVGVDVNPGEGTSCINAGSNGVIPVAILGSPDVRVQDIRLDDTLRLGTLKVRVGGKKPLCSVSRVNADGYDDLVCHFENAAGNWQTGQTSVTLTGMLNNGVPISGSDTICIKK